MQVNKSDIIDSIKKAVAVTGKEDGPLGAVRLSASDGKLTAYATNLDLFVSCSSDCVGDLPITHVMASKLLETLAKIKGDILTLNATEGNLQITSGKSKRNLISFVTELPEPPEFEGVGVAVNLNDIWAFCSASVDESQSNASLRGVNFERTNGNLSIAGTDGHKLAFIESQSEGDNFNATLSVKFMTIASKMSNKVAMLKIGARLVSVQFDDTTLTAKLISDDLIFPDWRRVVPKGGNILTVSANDMDSASTGVIPLADGYGTVVLNIEDGECSFTSASGSGDAVEPFPATWDGKDIAIGFNARYISEMCKAMGDCTLNIAMSGLKSPILAKTDGNKSFVIMPKRI